MSAAIAAIAVGVAGIGVGVYESQQSRNAMQDATNSSNAMSASMFNQQKAAAKPYLDSGTSALNQLNSEMPDLTRKFTAQDFQSDPGYQFQLQQGQQAMQRSAAAKGMLNSMGTQQNLNTYSQGLANTDYQQALGNFTNNQNQRYNMLQGLSQQGLQATGMTNAAAQNLGNNITSNNLGMANATGASNTATANSINSGLSTGANGLMNYNIMNQLNNLRNNQTGPYGMSMSQNSYGQMPNESQPTYQPPITGVQYE